MAGGAGVTPLPRIPDDEEPTTVRTTALKRSTLVAKPKENIEPIRKTKEEEPKSGLSEFYSGMKEVAKTVGDAATNLYYKSQSRGWKEQEAITELARALERKGVPAAEAREKATDSKWWEHMHKREKRIDELMNQNRVDRDQAVKLWKRENDYQ